jgi:hypothetical protein
MTRIVIDPNELNALSALCRNASYDAAGIATEIRMRVDHVVQLLHANNAAADPTVDAARIEAAVHAAVHQLHHAANELDADALAVATFGQRGAAADAVGELHGNDHALMARLHTPGEDKQ